MQSRPASVSDELEAIFLDATGLPSSRTARLRPSRGLRSFAPGRGRGRRIPVATLGAIAAAALVGLSAGAVMLQRPTGAQAPRPALPVVLNAAAPAPAPPPAEAAPPVVTVADANDSATDLAAPKVRAIQVSRPASRPASQVGYARRPSHADLLVADRRLRRAYARAIDAGVPRPVLASYRDRWADLRHDASWRPDRVQQGYDAMAGDLTRLSQRRHARHAPRRRAWPSLRSLW